MPSLDNLLVVAISSRALFDFEEENKVFDPKNEEPYMQLQLSKLDVPASKGVAFELARKLLSFNQPGKQRVEVVVLSKNDPISGLRVFKSAEHHGLEITRGAFVRGADAHPYLSPLRANLFLSADARDVQQALNSGVPAARVFARAAIEDHQSPDELRIAFDGDAVIFSDEAEQVYQQHGLESFQEHEKANARVPLKPGPFKPFLQALHDLKQEARRNGGPSIRIALMTARNAPSHERALRTLLNWQVDIDEAFFLGGLEKRAFLETFSPDFFFDDQLRHCEPAAPFVNTGHVECGVVNLLNDSKS